jgi:hypothetical protein
MLDFGRVVGRTLCKFKPHREYPRACPCILNYTATSEFVSRGAIARVTIYRGNSLNYSTTFRAGRCQTEAKANEQSLDSFGTCRCANN